jgi:hypothetical protein
MNPMSLLTKGSTLKGMKERPGRYKLLGNSVLPKFISPKNPFPTTPHPEPAKTQSALFEQPKLAAVPKKEEARPVAPMISAFVATSAFAKASASASAKASADKAACAMAEKKKKEEFGSTGPASVTPKQPQPAKPGLWNHLAEIPGGLLEKWIPWRKLPPFPSATVQTELALEKVTVMRNDFSEDDLEVVMIDKKAGKKAEKPAQSERVEHEKLTANP